MNHLNEEGESEMNPTTIGLDIAKNVFQAHGVDRNGKVVLRKRLSRGKVLEFCVNLPPCLIGLEACPGAHYWARELLKLGHAVKLMPAQYVKAYLKGNKNDGNDAEAICEAVSRPGMRFVAMNTEAQQDIQMLHRIRSRLVAAVNDGKQFQNGRRMAANLGLTPREHSSGGKQRLLGISKRGNTYLRTLLIHGARTVLRHATGKTDRLSRWAVAIQARRGANVAAVALANKLARIAWAVLARDRSYRADGAEQSV